MKTKAYSLSFWIKKLMVFFFLLSASFSYAANEAGKVTKISGEATAKQPNETARALAVGSIIFVKDLISVTEASNIEMLYLDGAVLALKEETEFLIDEYFYKKGSKDSKSVGSLATGGFRLLSGDIAKDPDKNKVKTPNAAIALVGTDVQGDLDDDALYVTCEKGRVLVSNAAGSILIGDGLDKYAVVTSFNRRPQIFIPTTTVRPMIRVGGK